MFYFLFLKEFLTRLLLHCFIILASEFERAFGKANCGSLSERLLLLVNHHNLEAIEHRNVYSPFV